MLFRFHTGSIKREAIDEQFITHGTSFDSILVRLKELKCICDALQLSKFRFHTGSIKSLRVIITSCNPGTSFDSILVRLKGAPNAEFIHASKRFRFHTGSIKRSGEQLGHVIQIEFRFHTGSIKSYACCRFCSCRFW